jgi:hypothetical protein
MRELMTVVDADGDQLVRARVEFRIRETLKKSSTGVSRCDSKEAIGVEIWIGR